MEEGKGEGEGLRRSSPPFPAQEGTRMIDGKWGSLIGFRGTHRNPLVEDLDLEERRESTDTSDGIIGDVSL